jgi:hypothetical protein
MLLGVPAVVNTPLDLLGTAQFEDCVHLVQCLGADDSHIADRIAILLTVANLRRSVGQYGRAFVSTHMDWDVIAACMETVFDQVRR